MPGNISAASPSTVLPQALCTAFQEARQYPMLVQPGYHDGTTERSIIVDGINAPTSIRTWTLSQRLTSTQTATLKAFYEARSGGLQPFYFYNPQEGSPIGSNYDASGTNTTGRHTVKFTSQAWTEIVGMARTNTSFGLIEVA